MTPFVVVAAAGPSQERRVECGVEVPRALSQLKVELEVTLALLPAPSHTPLL